MKKNYVFFLYLVLHSLSIKAQEEKRLALVIGNSDYKYLPKLKNPVGDAILIGQTLEMLGFEVTLDTNITTKRNFVKTITEFQVKRESFDVGFIFYAGHGVQVDGKNYLLPTREEFKTEAEIKEFALGAETIIEYLTWKTDEVNVLIFDACRNNPLENTRSTGRSGGLAEMRANGSLIAFSTTAGNVAKDGDGDHSVYSQSLAKNMLIEGISLDQVFRNVRREVFELTGQGTVNYDQLTGDAFYLKKGTFTDQYLLIDSLIIAENYEKGLEIAVSILSQDKNDKSAIIRKGRLYSFMGKYKLAEQDLNLAHEQYPGDMEVLLYRGRFYNAIDSTESALKDLNMIINIDSSNVRAFILRGQVYEKQEKFDQALADYSKAVEFDTNNPQTYTKRAIFYEGSLNEENNAFLDYSKAIELEPENAENWYNRGDFHYNFDHYKEAINDLEQALKVNPSHVDAINTLGLVYEDVGKIDLAIETYERGIVLEKTNPESAAYCYTNRARIFYSQEKFDKALADYSKAVELDPNNPKIYTYRAILYEIALNEENKAFLDYSKAIELEPENAQNWYNRGNFHYNFDHYKEAINDLEQALKVNPSYVDALNTLGRVYEDMGKIDLAIETYERGIALEKTNPKSAAYCYTNRARIFYSQEKFDKALADYSKAVELDPNNPKIYTYRAILYEIALNEENKAFLDYSKAIELEPENAENWSYRGNFHYNSDHDKEAINDLEQALKILPSHVDAINTLGVVYEDMGKIDLAIETYERGIALEKTNPKSAAYCYSNRASIYTDLEKFDQALADYSKAIELDPYNPIRYINRGLLYEAALNEENKAFLDYSKAIELEPENAENWYSRGDFHYNFDHYKEAINDLEQALKVNPSFVEAINTLGLVYADIGQIALAIETYERGIALEKTNPESAAYCYSNRASIYTDQEKFDQALADYSKAIELDPNNPLTHTNRAIFYEVALNEENNAFLDYSKAIKLAPVDFLNWRDRALFNIKIKNYKLAEKDFKEALKLAPTDIELICQNALFLAQTKELELALTKFENALKIDDQETSIYFYRAKAYDFYKEYEKAVDDYKSAIQINPDDPEGYFYLAVYYGAQNNILKASIYYTEAINRIGGALDYHISDDSGAQVPASKVYMQRAKLLINSGEIGMACADYQKALELMKDESFFIRKSQDLSELKEKIASQCD